MRKSVEAAKLSLYKTFTSQPSITFVETESPSKSTERKGRQSKIVFKNVLSEKSGTKIADEKVEKLQQLCHKYELQLEERTVHEQQITQELLKIKRKYQDLQRSY